MDLELDQFKDVNLVVDKANDIFIPRQFVSQGDYKGRTLTVQITNNGSIGEVPGLTLNLNWHNEASGLTDLTAFTILDKTNSIFRIEYPDNMMAPGKVYASIQIIQDGKVTNLKQFELIVQKLAGQPVGIVEKAEFSALVAALADSNKFRTDIDKKADKTYINDYLSQVTVVPETFTNLAAIKAKYPSGKNGLMVAADNGHKYIWANNVWTDAGVYQAVGIANRSITTPKVSGIAPYVIRDTYTDDVNISGWYGLTTFASSNHEITFTGKNNAGSGVLIPVDVPSDVTLDTDMYLNFTYNTSRVDSPAASFGFMLAKDDSSFFNTTAKLTQVTQTKTPTNISVKVNLKNLGYVGVPSHYNILVSIGDDYSVTIKDLYFNKTGVSQPLQEEIKTMDSSEFENGAVDLSSYTKWGDHAANVKLLTDNTLLMSQKYVSSSVNTSKDWGVEFPLNWDMKSDLYITVDASFSDKFGVLINTTGSLTPLNTNEFMSADGIYESYTSTKSFLIHADKLSQLGINGTNGFLLISHQLDGWFNIKSISISTKPGYATDKQTVGSVLENTSLRMQNTFGQNPELIAKSSTAVVNAYAGLNYGTPVNAPTFKETTLLKEVKVFSPLDTTVTFRIGTIDQNSLLVNNTKNVAGIAVKKGMNTIRLERSSILIAPGQRVFMTLNELGLYASTSDLPSFSKSLICDNTHYLNDGAYTGNQLYQTDNIIPFSYTLVEKSISNKIDDVTTATQAVSDSVADLLQLKRNLFVRSPSGHKFILMVDDNGNLTTKSSIPTNVVVVGNSLTYNWGNFGLAASNPKLDWYAHVKDYISGVNPKAVFNRFGLGDWESSTSTAGRDTVFNNEMKPALSNDTDLVIVQLGDNINTDEKNATFGNDAKKLIQNIKSVSPKATIVWVAAWYQSYPNLLNDISAACDATGSIFVNIRSIAQQSGVSSYIGAPQTDADGNTRNIDNSGRASHPGDKGHQLIADEVIRNFDF